MKRFIINVKETKFTRACGFAFIPGQMWVCVIGELVFGDNGDGFWWVRT